METNLVAASPAGRRACLVLALCISAGALVSCAAIGQGRSVQKAGFLGSDAALLERGGKDQPKLVYANPSTAWASYDKILLDPVTIWTPPGKKLGTSQADAHRMANNFHTVLYQALSKDYEMVQIPAPGAMRIQVAISELSGASVALNVISTAIPQARLATGLLGYATGKPLFTADVEIEMKATGSETQQLLAAGIDKEVGEKQLLDSWKTWEAVDKSFQYWAEMLRYRLCLRRGASDCVRPKVPRGF